MNAFDDTQELDFSQRDDARCAIDLLRMSNSVDDATSAADNRKLADDLYRALCPSFLS